MPGIGPEERRQDPDGRGLARTVRAEQTEDRSLGTARSSAVEGADLVLAGLVDLDQPSAVMTSMRQRTSGWQGANGQYRFPTATVGFRQQPAAAGPRPVRSASMLDRLRAWLDRWGAILPLLVAEFVVWLGFGGLLPVLPIYFEQQGLDLATLGLVIAAWPAARLVSEPVFGWLADRTARVPLMVIGLVATGVFGALPLVLDRPAARSSCSGRAPGSAPRSTTRPPAAS